MINKIHTIFWFLRKGYFPQLINILLRGKKEDTRLESTEWCRKYSVDEDTALKMLGITSYHEIDSKYLQYAKERFELCDTPMGGATSTKVLHNICKYFNPQKVIETGVAYGWSSLAILSAFKSNSTARLISIDMPYPKMNNEKNVGCVVHEILKKNWTLIKKPDIQGIPMAIKTFSEIDLIHYDSDKSYRGRVWAHAKIWDVLAINGIYIEDDINDNIAFKEFCEEINQSPIIVGYENKYLGILIKK